MKLVKFSILAVVVLLMLAVVAGLFMPRTWKVERSIVVQAPPETVHALLDDVHRWPEWYPYNKQKDETIAFAFGGSPRGAGAVLTWTSQKVGAGTLTLTNSDPKTGITYELSFAGFDRPSHGAIELAPQGAATTVTWRDGGELGSNPIPRLFRGMIERMLAIDFDSGLAKIKALAEAQKG